MLMCVGVEAGVCVGVGVGVEVGVGDEVAGDVAEEVGVGVEGGEDPYTDMHVGVHVGTEVGVEAVAAVGGGVGGGVERGEKPVGGARHQFVNMRQADAINRAGQCRCALRATGQCEPCRQGVVSVRRWGRQRRWRQHWRHPWWRWQLRCPWRQELGSPASPSRAASEDGGLRSPRCLRA